MIKREPISELRVVLLLGAAVVALSSMPYFYGLRITPSGYHFLGLTHNIDDAAVYLSWMRQAADGHFFIRNLFTSEHQTALPFNLLFLLMGNIGRVTHIPLIWVYHIFRAACGVCLIAAAWKLSRLFLEQQRDRLLFVVLLGVSSGIGWLTARGKLPRSIDLWQPEAITFLSIYLNTLFLAGQILMVGALYWLVMADRKGDTKHAIYAGLALLLLGNIHTYDVLTAACIWTAYVVTTAVAVRKLPVRTVKLSSLAALIAAPSVAYQLHVYLANPVYRARANTPAPSVGLQWLLSGYGLVLLGAIAGCLIWMRETEPVVGRSEPSTYSPRLLAVWSVIGFALPYIPVAQQRKLIMGLHIPLCMLCAYALGRLLQKNGWARALGAALFILAAIPSNILFVRHDIVLLARGDTAPRYVPFISEHELAAMRWLREKTSPDDTVLAPPTFALFVPAMIGHQVYYGHWSETPDYVAKRKEWTALALAMSEGELPPGALGQSGIDYIVHYAALNAVHPPPDLTQVFNSGDVIIYRVD